MAAGAYPSGVSTLESVWDHSTRDAPMITRVADYAGEEVVAIAATQLGTDFTRTEASRIVQEWVDFFTAGPTPIVELQLATRTPKRLFHALGAQTQLQRLFVKWVDYDDLGPLAQMDRLRVLRLGGASCVNDVGPIAALAPQLTNLEIESLRRVKDLRPLAALTSLRQLELGGDWMSLRVAHIDSIAWLTALRDLEHLVLHTIIVDDLDYTALLRLQRLQAVRVMEVKGMRPTIHALRNSLPWDA